jgi:hypothetical protein
VPTEKSVKGAKRPVVNWEMTMNLPNVSWTYAKTYSSDAPHEYLLRHTAPDVFDWYKLQIAEKGIRERFTLRGKTATYRYFYPGDGFRYWICGIVLNRAVAEPDSAGSGGKFAPTGSEPT